jgi:YfiH family protein
MGGPDMAPQTPQRSERPGEPGAPLDCTRGSGEPAQTPQRSGQPGEPGAALGHTFASGGAPLYFTFSSLEAIGLRHATTTRHFPGTRPFGAVTSPFLPEAREALLPAGLDLTKVAYGRQVHGVAHARVTSGGLAGVVDILVTTARGLPLAISTADCLAITVCDPDAPALAIAHVGWRGTVQGGAAATLAALAAAGAGVERMRVGIGPSIGPCCYEVDEPVIARFREAYPRDWERWVRPGRPEHWMLDLWTANEDLLAAAGLARSAIENPRLCTACQPDLFFSYRKGHRGRLITVAALP